MSLRFFADHCVPASVIQSLADAGHEVLRLRDCMPPDSPDESVIAKAQELDSILVSLNGDFADIVRYPPSEFRGIVALQVRNHPEIIPQIISRLKDYLLMRPQINDYKGTLLLVEAHRIRRKL